MLNSRTSFFIVQYPQARYAIHGERDKYAALLYFCKLLTRVKKGLPQLLNPNAVSRKSDALV